MNPNLRKLTITGKFNNIIPEEIFTLKNLQKLNLSNNNIKHLPSQLSNLRQLELLDLSTNQINVIYAKIFELHHLKVLILNNNKLVNLSKQISKLKKLKILSIPNNSLTSLPESIGDLQNLEVLNISNNMFDEFPMSILQLKKLKRLWVGNNHFHNFPIDEIKKISSLQSLYCYSNRVFSDIKIDKIYLKLAQTKGNSLSMLYSQIEEIKAPTTMMLKPSKISKTKIFISYSHEDGTWLTLIKKHLKVLHFENDKIDVWDDSKIKTGTNWKIEIEKSLAECKIAILILSTNFLASDFINNNELPPLLQLAKSKGTIILPIIVSPCRFSKNKDLNVFQSVNNPLQPLSDLSQSEQEKVLLKLADEIENNLEED